MSLLTWLGFSPPSRAYILLQMDGYETRFDVFAQQTARTMGVKGWVHMTRLPLYRKAEMEVEGKKSTIEMFLKKLNEAPRDARATSADVQWKTYKNLYHDFRIK